MSADLCLRVGCAAIVSVALFAACSRRDPPLPVPERAPSPAIDAGSLAPSASPTTAAPSFRRDILPVLLRDCATAKGCHGPAPTDSVHLDLRPAAAYPALVGQEAEARKGALRVSPGDPARSFLLAKLTGALGPNEGKAMPIDVDTGAPILPSPVSSGFIHDTLEPWIAAGAPNN